MMLNADRLAKILCSNVARAAVIDEKSKYLVVEKQTKNTQKSMIDETIDLDDVDSAH